MSDPAEVFHPGVYLKEEIEAREWTWRAFENKSGIEYLTLCDLIYGTQDVTAELAAKIAAAFGTSADFWLNLQASWDAEGPRPTALIPNEAELHARLVMVWQFIQDKYNVDWNQGFIAGVSATLTFLYGEDEALRVIDTARMEALL